MNPEAWRKKRGLSLREVARLVGASKSAIQRYERGERDPPLSVARAYRAASRGQVTEADLAAVREHRGL